MNTYRMGSLAATVQFRARTAIASSSVRDVIRRARSEAPKGGDPWVNRLADEIIGRHRKNSLEHITAFVLDLAQRGDLQGAEMIGRELIAQARLEYERTHPTEAQVPIPVVHLAEEHAEGIAEEAEIVLAHEPNRCNAEKVIQTGERYITEKERFLDRVRRQYVGAP